MASRTIRLFERALNRVRIADPVMGTEFQEVYSRYRTFTLTPLERMYSLYKAVAYVLEREIPGDFVECGVWRGGSAMIIAHLLAQRGVKDRRIYLYDTFQGMSAPTASDVSWTKDRAVKGWDRQKLAEGSRLLRATLDDVRRNVLSTGLAESQFVFVQGRVEDTLPGTVPPSISLLRLDTDWYESTRHELRHLYPRLAPGGVLLIDDYGYWLGARKAVDEYFSQEATAILLSRIDISGRIGVKQP